MSEWKGTRGPWNWADGWGRIGGLWNDDEECIEKHVDFQLFGADAEEIIPIRIDHREPIWDVDPSEMLPSEPDRLLIASACNACLSFPDPLAAARGIEALVKAARRVMPLMADPSSAPPNANIEAVEASRDLRAALAPFGGC